MLVLADHSIFINRMMLPREINNLEFAANCLHWLRGGASTPLEIAGAATKGPDVLQQLIGQRNHVLFWEDSKVHRDFNVPLKKVSLPPTLPPEPAIVASPTGDLPAHRGAGEGGRGSNDFDNCGLHHTPTGSTIQFQGRNLIPVMATSIGHVEPASTLVPVNCH